MGRRYTADWAMSQSLIQQQQHGYRRGHELLASTTVLSTEDQDLVDRLSDLSGPLSPGETFQSYVTGYPLPSEIYYVLARTWQDTTAPRAGCVLTHSLLIPMAVWQNLQNLSGLLTLMTPFAKAEGVQSMEPAVMLNNSADSLSFVEDSRVVELIEALFLETRQPIAMFDANEAEVIAFRLLSAFWPALRRKFSLCTMALAPRGITGRPFDLLFVPKSARSRFADWNGRRIDMLPSQGSSPRHRWSNITAQRVFRSNTPHLAESDSIGMLVADNRGDESALRLTLLWDELQDKSETSPTAVLGMLDILSSLASPPSKVVDELTPTILRAIELAGNDLPHVEFFKFCVTLLGKFPDRLPRTRVLRLIRRISSQLAELHAEGALDFLRSAETESMRIPAILFGGLGDGIAQCIDHPNLIADVLQFRSETVLGLVAFSRVFAIAVFRRNESGDVRSTAERLAVVVSSDEEFRSRARRNLVPALQYAEQASLLSALLAGVTTKSLTAVVMALGRSTQFSINEFDTPLLRAARGAAGLVALRVAVEACPRSPGADRLLVHSLRFQPEDLEWLRSLAQRDKKRSLALLLPLIEKEPNQSLRDCFGNADAQEQLLMMLRQGLPLSSLQFSRVLIWSDLPVERMLEDGLEVLPHLPDDGRAELIEVMMRRALSEADSASENLVRKVVKSVANTIESRNLIAQATPGRASTYRLSQNLMLLSTLDDASRQGVFEFIEELTDRTIRVGDQPLIADAYQAWASLIADAGSTNREGQLRAASAALSYSLRLIKAPVSPLIVVVFPLVYSELQRGIDPPNIFQTFFFSDWDRCKAARARLVEAFVESCWPPADFVLTAARTSDAHRILLKLAHHRNGEAYFRAIDLDLSRFPTDQRIGLEMQLAEFRASRDFPRAWSD